MKKITILGLILLGLGFSPLLVSADIPMGPGWHYVDSCVKITNLNEFPDITVVGVNRGAMEDGTNGFLINNNECIKEGYKFTLLAVGWIDNNKFKSIDLENLKVNDSYLPSEINILSEDLPFYVGEVKDNTYIKAITKEYIIKQKGELLSLSKSKEITEYNNGKPLKIETFGDQDKKTEIKKNDTEVSKENNTNDNQDYVQPAKKGFWKSILCFFKIGKNC